MIDSILKIVAALAALGAGWYLSKKINYFYQKYQDYLIQQRNKADDKQASDDQKGFDSDLQKRP